MRLFVAVEIDETLAAKVVELIREIQTRVAAAAPRARVMWGTADRLHITVRFIGDVDDARAAAIRTTLEAPLGVAPYDLTLAGTGTFPSSGAPRVLWAGVGRGQDALRAAERDVSARLARLGLVGGEQQYNPHLTLARVRDAGGLRSARLLDGLEDRHIGATSVDAITLFQSRLSPQGPTYVPLLRTPLGGP